MIAHRGERGEQPPGAGEGEGRSEVGSWAEPGSERQLAEEAPPSPAKRVVASAGAVIELLLGCLANLAPHNPMEVHFRPYK